MEHPATPDVVLNAVATVVKELSNTGMQALAGEFEQLYQQYLYQRRQQERSQSNNQP